MLLLCSMGGCSGQLVRSFLLAVKPHYMLHPSLFNAGHLLLQIPSASESAVRG